MNTYVANWQIQGLKDSPDLQPGETIELDEETAAPLVKGGSLLPLEEAGPTDPDPNVDLSAMTKAQLVQYAKEKLELELDINEKKDTLLAAIVEAADK